MPLGLFLLLSVYLGKSEQGDLVGMWLVMQSVQYVVGMQLVCDGKVVSKAVHVHT